MAPFDFPLVQDDMLSDEKLSTHPLRLLDRLGGSSNRRNSVSQIKHPALPECEMQDAYRRVYSLVDGDRVRATSGLPTVNWENATQRSGNPISTVHSVTTTDYAEFILQLLDKNSFLSSIMIVCAYILIFRAL